MTTGLPISARRVFRLALAMALSVACAYGFNFPLPYIAPIFALILTLKPGSAMPMKGIFGLVGLIIITCSAGLLLVTVLDHYAATGFMLVALGLFVGNHMSINRGKGAIGALLTMGLTLISAAGLAEFTIGLIVVQSLVMAVCLAVLCQHVCYLLFPEDLSPAGAATVLETVPDRDQSNWLALRATLIVLPTYLMVLVNPGLYTPVLMKSVSLGQQASITDTHHAGRELLGSTFLGGALAIILWFALGLHPSLWMFFLWILFFGIWIACKLYRIIPSRYPSSFWMNAAITVFILLGPAVQDSANGKDVYKAFAVRMCLLIAVTLYAWVTVAVLERLRERRMTLVYQIPQSEETI